MVVVDTPHLGRFVSVPSEAHFADLTGLDFRVLVALLILADPADECYASRRWVADVCQITPRKVSDHLAKLESAGLLTIERRPRHGGPL